MAGSLFLKKVLKFICSHQKMPGPLFPVGTTVFVIGGLDFDLRVIWGGGAATGAKFNSA
jgi:hypothetical protein